MYRKGRYDSRSRAKPVLVNYKKTNPFGRYVLECRTGCGGERLFICVHHP
jgi:hypothetical protein